MDLIGKFEHYKSENLKAYLTAAGVPYVARALLNKSNPVIEINKQGELWDIKVNMLYTSIQKKFKLNEEYNEEIFSLKLKCTTTLDNGKLITVSLKESENKTSKTIYELQDPNTLIVTLIDDATGEIAKRFYKRKN